jgi:hypothetical protein
MHVLLSQHTLSRHSSEEGQSTVSEYGFFETGGWIDGVHESEGSVFRSERFPLSLALPILAGSSEMLWYLHVFALLLSGGVSMGGPPNRLGYCTLIRPVWLYGLTSMHVMGFA